MKCVAFSLFLAFAGGSVGCTGTTPDPAMQQPGGDPDLALADAGAPPDLPPPPPDLVDPGPPPTLSAMMPTAGDWGTQVELTGTHLTNITAVTYGGSSANFTVEDDSHLRATVPTGVGTRPFVVSGPAGQATTPGTFAIPTKVSSFYPITDIYSTDPFYVYGYSFTGATAVKVGGIPVSTFTVLNDEQIVCMLDPTTQSTFQKVTVVAPGGSATSTGTFFVRCTRDEQCPGSFCVNGNHTCN
jgi:hypothetical protein